MVNQQTTKELIQMSKSGMSLMEIPIVNAVAHLQEFFGDDKDINDACDLAEGNAADDVVRKAVEEEAKKIGVAQQNDDDYVPSTEPSESEQDDSSMESEDSTDDMEAQLEGGEDNESSVSERPVRGGGEDPYYDIWNDFSEEEKRDSLKPVKNKLDSSLNAIDPSRWQKDGDDFAKQVAPPDWNAFNYT